MLNVHDELDVAGDRREAVLQEATVTPAALERPVMSPSDDASADLTELKKWAPAFVPSPSAQVRLLCLPYAGAGASTFRGWQTEVRPAIQVVPVQLPGRENRWEEGAYVNLPSLAAKLVSVLTPVFDEPYALFGHSMGGLIVFEMARQIERQHLRLPQLLFISGTRPPHMRDPEGPIHMLPDAAFLKKLTSRFGGKPNQALLNPELCELLLPVLRADFAMCETFHAEPDEPLAIPITAFGGKSDRGVVYDHLVRWSLYTCATFNVRLFSGDHFFLTRQSRSLLRALSDELAAVPTKADPTFARR